MTPMSITCIHFFFSTSSKEYSLYFYRHTLSSCASSTSCSSRFRNETMGFFLTFDGALRTMMNSYSHFGPSFKVIFFVSSFVVGFSMNQQSCSVSEFTMSQFLRNFFAFLFKYLSNCTTSSLFGGSSFSIFSYCSSIHSLRYLNS
jgi:hypothetical protein